MAPVKLLADHFDVWHIRIYDNPVQ